MLVTWLIEIYLNQMGELKEQGQEQSQEYETLQENFRQFLHQPRVKVRLVFVGMSEFNINQELR